MGKRRRMDWKGRVCRKLNPDGIAIRMIQNEGFRLGIFAVCGFAFNIIFAVLMELSDGWDRPRGLERFLPITFF